MVQDLTKKNIGGELMTIIRCKKSPSVNPYVVNATNMVKECPTLKTIEQSLTTVVIVIAMLKSRINEGNN
jgi:hypothetical protein